MDGGWIENTSPLGFNFVNFVVNFIVLTTYLLNNLLALAYVLNDYMHLLT
jgi:hypothetical protein